MKICVVSQGDAYDKKNWSGTTLAITLALEKRGVEIVYLNLNKVCGHPIAFLLYRIISKISLNKLKFYPDAKDPLFFKKNILKINTAINNTNADVCLFIAETSIPLKSDKNYYCYIDACFPYTLKASNKKYIFHNQYRLNTYICCQSMDGFFTMNEWSAKSTCETYDYPKNQIQNVGFGINTNFYYGKKDYCNQELMIVLRKKLEYIKGLDLLLDAFEIAKNKINGLRLSVVGTTGRKIEGVTYYYKQPREVTVKLFQKSTLYVMPARNEPNGITYMEALAAKTPIIGLDRFAFPEFAGYGEFGFIAKNPDPIEVAQVICEALSDPIRLEKMGKNGQEFVKNRYQWGKVADIMMEEFERGMKK